MIHNLRSRLRAVVATGICALVAAPALIAGSATTAAAAPPGITASILTVGGQGSTNPWNFYGGYYSELQAAIQASGNFGANGIFKKGSFAVSPAALPDALSFPGNLSSLDVFFAGLPDSEYDSGDTAALQAFNADGRALVLNSNAVGFGDVASFLGFNLRTQRAFFGNEPGCGWTFASEHAPNASSATAPTHKVVDGPFGTASTVTNYHTVNVFTGGLPAQAQGLYNLTVPNQAPQFAITGPVGDSLGTRVDAYLQGAFTIDTAVITPYSDAANTVPTITRVDFFDGAAGGTSLGFDTSFPFSLSVASLTEGAHTLTAVATLATAGTITDQIPVTFDVAPFNPPVPQPTIVANGCAGAGGEIVNDNISGSTVAVIPAKALSANSGPIIVTSDLDSMSNAFPDPEGSWTSNRTFTLNVFAWIMDQMLPDVPDDTYFPLANPARVYDSRLAMSLAHQETRAIQVAGVGGVPADAKTVIANVTVVDPESSGYLTVFPTGGALPNTSTHNFEAGENFANMVTMQVGQGGAISVFDYLNSGSGFVDVLVDIVGYTRRDNSGTRLHTMAPVRLLDTRNAIGLPKAPFGPGVTQNLTVRGGSTGVPVDAESVVLNMTVTNVTHTGSFITVWPTGAAPPNVSNLNNVEGIARPNLVVAHVGTGGQIAIRNDSGNADVLADVVGYFSAGAYKSGGVITGVTPKRILDTRSPSNPFAESQIRSYTVAGVGGIPGNAKTAILKVTAVDPTAGGFITVWPNTPGAPPNVSNLNFVTGMTIPNLVITQIGTAGQINIYNAFGTTHVLIDVLGYAD